MRLDFFKKNNKIGAGVLVLTLLIGFTAYNYLSDSKQSALGFVPEEYSFFIYFRNVPEIKDAVKDSKNFKNIEENYFYQDLKSRFSKNLDFFFFQADFNLEYFIQLIQGDLAVGKSKGRYFLSASISAQARALETIFRLMPQENIQELSTPSYKYYKLSKNGKTYFYALLNNYFLLTDSDVVLSDMATAASKKIYRLDKDIAANIEKRDFVMKLKIGPEAQVLNLLPDFSDLTIHYKWNEGSYNLSAGLQKSSKAPVVGNGGYEFLKLSGYDTPFCYYKSNFNLQNILDDALKTEKGAAQLEKLKSFLGINPVELTKKIKSGVFVAFNGFSFASGAENGRIVPETSLIFEIAEKLSQAEKTVLVEKAKKSLEFFFGAVNWKETKNQPKNYAIFESTESAVSLTATEKMLIVSFSKPAQENIISHIDQINPSVYDRYSQTFTKNQPPAGYFYLNLNSFMVKLEPILRYYVVTALQMDDDEYQKSFGALMDMAKKTKPYYGSVFYSQEGKKFNGEIKPVE